MSRGYFDESDDSAAYEEAPNNKTNGPNPGCCLFLTLVIIYFVFFS